MRQKSWNSISAWLRVLTKISVVLLRLIRSYISPSAWRAVCPAHGRRSLVSSISTTGAAAPPATTISAETSLPSRCGTRKRASNSGSATVAESPIARISGASRHSRASPSDKQIAALGGDERMQFVEHDALERGEQKRRIVGRQQQRQLLGRGEQDIRRIAPLPLPPRHRRIAGAGLDLDRQPHLGDRRLQIARDVDGERLQRRDVEGVEAAGALHAAAGGDEALLADVALRNGRGQLHQRRQKSGQRLAGAGRRDQQRGTVVAGLCQQRELMLTRRPAARGEPAPEAVGQQRSRFKRREGQGIGRRHGRRGKPSGRVRRGLRPHLAPLAGRGRIARRAIRVRGSDLSRIAPPGGESPSP